MSSGFIARLPTDVINRIAAGEVVQRPSAALKELLENSLDAGSGSIAVTAAEGGLGALQVADDGSGVRHGDLPLLCERYATSKLRCFEDLQSIASFGFRGEALASVSYVARVTVTTRRRPTSPSPSPSECHRQDGLSSTTTTTTTTVPAEDGGQDSRVAWRCRYMDGALIAPPQPCAGNYGTVIRAENIFYNAHVRRAALKPGEEWRRLLDVVSRYALAFPHVGFSCQKEGGGGGGDGLTFPKNSSTLDNIRLLLGIKVASHLRFIFYHSNDSATTATAAGEGEQEEGEVEGGAEATQPSSPPQTQNGGITIGSSNINDYGHDATVGLSQRTNSNDSGGGGYRKSALRTKKDREQQTIVSRVTAAAKRTQALTGAAGDGEHTIMGYTSDATLLSRRPFLTLFVNNRLVESTSVRRTIDAVYSSVLAGGNKPTTVLFLTVPSDRLDVNVHPTKKEVCFLDEEAVLGRLSELLRSALVEAAAERQVDVTSLSKATTLALQAAVRYSGNGNHGTNGNSNTSGGGSSSASQGIMTFLQQQQQSLSSGGGSARSLATGGPAVVVAPCTMVRVEPQRGALEAFLRPIGSLNNNADGVSSSSMNPVRLDEEENGDGGDAVAVKAEGGSEAAAAPPVVDWAAVLASVKPAVDPGSSSAGGGGCCDGGGAATGVAGATATTVNPLTFEGPASQLDKDKGNYNDDEDDDDDDDDDDRADLMREFKRFKQEGGGGGEQESPALTSDSTHHYAGAYGADSAASRVLLFGGTSTSADAAALANSAGVAAGDALMRAGGSGELLPITQLEDHVLSSVTAVADRLAAATSATAQQLVDSLAFVGVVDGGMFLAQSGTSLVVVDTLRLVREVVFQRVFLRWAQPSLPRPPQLSPTAQSNDGNSGGSGGGVVNISDAILFAMYHDAKGMAGSLTTDSPLVLLLQREAVSGGGGAVSLARHRETAAHKSTNHKDGDNSSSSSSAIHHHGNASALSPLEAQLLARAPALLFHKPNTSNSGGCADASLPLEALATAPCRRYVRSLVRRLLRWRPMLEEYFSIAITQAQRTSTTCGGGGSGGSSSDDTTGAFLVGLPCGLNTSWLPCPRAVPLFLWLLAESVPFPTTIPTTTHVGGDGGINNEEEEEAEAAQVAAESRCFQRIARLIADVLYGLSTLHFAISPSNSTTTTITTPLPTSGVAAPTGVNASDNSSTAAEVERAQEQRAALAKAVRFGLLPCAKSRGLFLPPAELLSNGCVQSVVTVESLYKVFERC